MFEKLLSLAQVGKRLSAAGDGNKTAIKDELALLLKSDPSIREQFETAYRKHALEKVSDNLFEVSAQRAMAARQNPPIDSPETEEIIDRIVGELLMQTPWFRYDGKTASQGDTLARPKDKGLPSVTLDELKRIPPEIRPQLTGRYTKCDIPGESYKILLDEYTRYLRAPNTVQGRRLYNMFRQGLDILDLDGVTYEIIRMNPNSIGRWLPALVDAAMKQDFFRVPATTIIEVPITLLQLTRCDYNELTTSTLAVLDRYCQEAFGLDTQKEYFVKTGTYSSKFDFRNAHVHGKNEVQELGEYLLFIHFLACQMASPLNNKSIYGVSTTTEWAVREFIPDKENNPTIYMGMPLHTEYRVFVDFDAQKVIGVSPYWEPETMKKRFGHEDDADSPHKIHDYVVYKAHEETLMRRYQENVDAVCVHIEAMLPDIRLCGQWSIDVMQNGEDFWIIDMALAQNSALIECVPKNLLRPAQERWVPALEDAVKANS